MRLIDADALKLSMMLIAPGETKKYCYPCKEILKEIDDAPTIEERKTGRWIVVPGMNEQCSECGKFFPLSYFKDRPFEINYCPNCGAKMETKYETD